MKPKSSSQSNFTMYTYHMKQMVYVSNYRKRVITVSVCATILLIAVVISLVPQFLKRNHLPNKQQHRYAMDLKYILFWTAPNEKNKMNLHYRGKRTYPRGQTLFINQKCAHFNCFLTYNRSLLRDDWNFDAVVFDMDELRKFSPEKFNLTRSLHQKYIFKSLESSENNPLCYPFFDDFFNWTWTYKLVSDIPHPFINIYDKNNALIGPRRNMTWKNILSNANNVTGKHVLKNKTDVKSLVKDKTKAVAWLLEKCQVKALYKDFLENLKVELKLRNYTLDILGPCGQIACSPSHKCYKTIEKYYYFQLVLEDSVTEDYVTDILVKVMNRGTIPIVYGGNEYFNFLPPGAFVKSQDGTAKSIVSAVDYLIKHPKTYEYILEQTQQLRYTTRSSNYLCDLCGKLNDVESVSDPNNYSDLRKWWNPEYEDVCHRMQLYNFFNNKDYL